MNGFGCTIGSSSCKRAWRALLKYCSSKKLLVALTILEMKDNQHISQHKLKYFLNLFGLSYSTYHIIEAEIGK